MDEPKGAPEASSKHSMSEPTGRGGAWTDERGAPATSEEGRRRLKSAPEASSKHSILEEAGELTRRGEAFALATVVWRQGPSSGQQGSRAIITASGELRGWIGGACAEPAVIREARQVITEGVPRLLLLGSTEFSGTGRAGAEVPDGVS